MFQYSPYALLYLIAMLVSIWLGYIIWSRRPGKAIVPFVVMAVGLMIWTLGNLVKISFTNSVIQIMFHHLMYVGITIVPAAWLIFILAYTDKTKWITRRNILLLFIEPILVQIVLATNPLHQSFAVGFAQQEIDGLLISTSTAGGLFWVHAIYSYILILIGCAVLLRTMIGSPELYRGQIIYLLIGAFTPWIANIVYLAGLSPFPDFVDLTPFAFVITAIATAWSMYRFRLLDIVPIARDAIIENMEDAIVVLDMTQRVVDVNATALRLLNKASSKVIGQAIKTLLPNRLDLIESFNGIENTETELELIVDEKMRFYKLRLSAIYNRQQEVSGHILVLHDITSLKETNIALKIANEKAQENTQLKSQFLATMSHELRTPLNAIIGYTELQLEGIVGELTDTQRQYQERVFANASHLLGLINDILDLSKIEAGRMELIQEPFQVHQWIDEIVSQNRVLSDEKGIDLSLTIDDSLPYVVVGDAGRLRQIVTNLMSNAIKFTSEGSVEVSLKLEDNKMWSIIVKDTGIGIPPHKQETIFDEFHQVDNSSTRQHQGTGLGLAIVRKLILSMGGTIRLNSTLGEGSQFIVMLPLQEVQRQDEQKQLA